MIITISSIYLFNNPFADFKVDKKEGIQFYRGSWKDALAQSKKENKRIFLDIYATWCGPCKRLKNNSFSNRQVGEFYNSSFINVSLDGEKGEGAVLANDFKVTGYPSLFFIDTAGNVIKLIGGYLGPNELLNSGRIYNK